MQRNCFLIHWALRRAPSRPDLQLSMTMNCKSAVIPMPLRAVKERTSEEHDNHSQEERIIVGKCTGTS